MTSEPRVKLNFTRSGGIAPVILTCHLNTDELPKDKAQKLRKLVAQSGIMDAQGATVKGARDVHYFTIEIDLDGKQHHVHFDQLSLPQAMRPLVMFLSDEAKLGSP